MDIYNFILYIIFLLLFNNHFKLFINILFKKLKFPNQNIIKY